MFYKFCYFLFSIFKQTPKLLKMAAAIAALGVVVVFVIGKLYQSWDDDENRGAIAIENGAFGESYSTPVYLDQGWDEADSLWFYNTTQGSALLPYDLFLALENSDSEKPFVSDENADKFRYLPQKPTFFNPDGLPIGFAKETYQGKDYVGYTCAACHTGQINVRIPGEETLQAIRIDGAPSMADMVGYLTALEKALIAAQKGEKNERFVKKVLAQKNDYKSKKAVQADLQNWTERRKLYNTINHSHIKYGYARLDAFGRIYNRVLQHAINREQLADSLSLITRRSKDHPALLSLAQIKLVLDGVDETVIGDEQFAMILDRLRSKKPGYPGLSVKEMLYVRNEIFNEPNAPVSYPFLWDIPHSDYVQWNGIASNAGVGPIGRNTGEVIGVFAIIDWQAGDPGFSISSWLTGQTNKKKVVDFKSSVDLVNLRRLEAHLRSLKSPEWPENIIGAIDYDKAARGKRIYGNHCQGCHELIDRDDADRRVIGKMMGVDKTKTDPAMATNSVMYSGKSGNFKHTYQDTDVGAVMIEEKAPVAQILTAVTKGVVATPDADKMFIRRWADWVYTLFLAFTENEIKASVKSGNYTPDTTASPYNSLLAYKARSLNGIWATAPYLHNGSVPTLYDLLLPVRAEGDPADGEYRPDEFRVGAREFDPIKVGFISEGYEGSRFTVGRVGDKNTGHEYGKPLSTEQRWELVEYLKTL